MKDILNKYKTGWYAVWCILAIGTSLLMHSCTDDETTKIVDLRYRAKDTYNLPASNPQAIKIQVKSSEQWMVYSDHPDWCSISPEQGEAGETFDVSIQYKANTELDDRTDTITVKSDYWVGKWITVIQKGIAYLNTENADDILLSKEEADAEATFKVLANQNWTAKVTEGEAWLSIKGTASGTNDGTLTVTAISNPSEKRYGTVTLYDRHNVAQQTVKITQDGIQIDPDKTSFRESYEAHSIEIQVISNGTWTVAKEDALQDWYLFSSTSFNGDGTLTVTLNENTGTAIRKATFTLSSEAIPGVEPVVRTITIQQAYNGTERHIFDAAEGKNWNVNNGTCSFSDAGFYSKVGRVTQAGMQPGYYSFHIKEMAADAQAVIFFTYSGGSEIRWHLNMATGKTNYSTLPYSELAQKSFDKSKGSYTLGLSLTKAEDGNMNVAWYLDGELCTTYRGTFGVEYGTTSLVYIGTNISEATYDWWEYTPNYEWGD